LATFVPALLKRKYSTAAKVENAALIDNPFLALVSRKIDPEGESYTSFLTVAGGQGWSGTRAAVQTIAGQTGNIGNGDWVQVTNRHGKVAGEVRFTEASVKRAESGSAAAMRSIAAHVDSHLESFGNFAEGFLLNHRGGYLCTFTVSSGVCTITSNPEHVSRIRKGMIIVASAADGTSGSLIGSPSLGYVRNVSRSGSTTTFTVSTTAGGNAGTPTDWTGTMYAFIHGTWFGANGGAGVDAGTDEAFIIDTLDAWCPASAPGATLYKGIDRTTDDLLGGVRLTSAEVAGKNIAQRLELLAMTGRARFGWKKRKRKAFVHTSRFNELSQLLQSTDFRDATGKREEKSVAGFGYNVIHLTCTGADVEVIDTPLCDPDTAWMLDPDDWLLHSHAGWPSVMDDDGLKFVRIPADDAYMLQYTGYGSFRTEKPSEIGRCPLN